MSDGPFLEVIDANKNNRISNSSLFPTMFNIRSPCYHVWQIYQLADNFDSNLLDWTEIDEYSVLNVLVDVKHKFIC